MKKHVLLNAAAAASAVTGFNALVARRYGGIGSTFVLHSVVHDRRAFLNGGLHTSAAFLERMLRFYRGRYVAIVSLDEVEARLAAGNPEPFVSFTFDDGYRDNLTTALPLFERYQAPLTIYVATAMIKRCMDYWWGCLREIIKVVDTVEVEELGLRLPTASFAQKVAAYERLSAYGRINLTRTADLFSRLFARHGVRAAALLEDEAMDEAELRAAAQHRLVTIGGHTTTHRPLAALPEDEAGQDITDNKAYVEAVTQRPASHFAYPFGGAAECGEREAALVRAAGYRTAATVRNGNIFPAHAANPTALPRLYFEGRNETRAFMEFQRSGALRALLSRGASPVVTL